MRRAIVHIGTPRTGTTTLQRILFDRRAELRSAGILYPDLTPESAAEPHLSHQHLGEALAGRRPARERAELLDQLEAALRASGCDTVLLSYEALCLIPASFKVPQTLAALFARHGVAMETMLTLKPQAEYLNSTYTWRMQFLREARRFPGFLDAHLAARDCDYGALAAPWRAACADRLSVVPVRDATDRRPLVERVFGTLGLSDRMSAVLGGGERGLVENRSPGPVAVEVCRLLRRGGAAMSLGRRAREATRLVEGEARARGCDAVAFMGHDPASRAVVEARWGRANDRFARSVWGTDWSARVAAEPLRAMNEIARMPHSPDAEAHVAAILRQVCEASAITLHGPMMARLLQAGGLPAAALRHVRNRLRMPSRQ